MPIGRPCLARIDGGRRCPGLATSGSYCPAHQRGDRDSEPWRKLYGTRAWMLATEAAKNRAGHRCERCAGRKPLQVHHRVKLAQLWRVRSSWVEFVREACDQRILEVLCPKCHARAERRT